MPDEDSDVSAEDLGEAVVQAVDDGADIVSVPSPMASLPVGATFGSLVHAVLEHADPAAEDFRGELLRLIGEQLVWWPVELDPGELADALVAVCSSPLGPLAGDRTLLSLGLPDRLRELDFEVPLAGGDTTTAPADVRLGDLAPLLRRHLPEGDPLRAYADALDADPDLAAQSPARLPHRLHRRRAAGRRRRAERYLTVDYKTNWLGRPTSRCTAARLPPRACSTRRWRHSDYPLQALLYTVVLHRYLRWRLPGYDPATHLGGVLYLYLRGMCGPDDARSSTASPCGVFSWRPAGRAGHRSSPTCWTGWWGGRHMTDLFEPLDAHDRDLALGATGLLGAFNAAGVLTAADVHVARASAGWSASSDERCCSPSRSRSARCAAARSALDLATVPASLAASTCRGPIRPRWSAAVAASPAVTAGVVHVGTRSALPRPLPRAGDAGPRRPARPGARGAHRRPRAAGAVARARLPRHGLRRAARGLSPCRHPVHDRDHRRAGHRQDHRRRRVSSAALVEQAETRGETLRIALAAPDRQGRRPAAAVRARVGRALRRRPTAARLAGVTA